MALLVTGFGPFGNFAENPAEKLARASGESCHILPVSYRAFEEFVLAAPAFDQLLMIGVAGGASLMRLEVVGRNVMGPVPDVDGVRGPSQIDPQAPFQLGSTLWSSLVAGELPEGVEVSYDAGNYLCNYSLFRALQVWPDREVGFLHIPPLEAMAFEKQLSILGEILARL